MYSTSELDELFQILNSVKGFKLDNHIGATQQYLMILFCVGRGVQPDVNMHAQYS